MIAARAVGFGALLNTLLPRALYKERDHIFFHQQALFVSMLGQVTPRYSVMASVGVENTTYRQNDGINRVNEQPIDDGTYLTGGPVGGAAAISDYGTEIDLTGTATLSPHAIDGTFQLLVC